MPRGITMAARMEPRLTYRVFTTTAVHTASPANALNGAKYKKTPNPVSPLFPPLKAAKHEKECPNTAMAPAASAQGRDPVKRVANQAAANPLPASLKATGRAGFQ